MVFKDDLSQILGVSDIEVKNSQGTDEFGGFGEGYTLEEYELSEKTVQAFINNASKTLPDKKEEGKNWQKKDWSKVPVDSSYSEILTMCLNYSSGSTKLETQLNEIKKMLEKIEVYYSFYYKPDEDNPQDAQLFILDVQSRKVYVIESNI